MANANSTGGTQAYTPAQRSALAVASVRLRLMRRHSLSTDRDLADALLACARAVVPVGDVVDLIDTIFPDERIPAARVGAAYRLAQMIETRGDGHAQ
jgi:hypothetical protein